MMGLRPKASRLAHAARVLPVAILATSALGILGATAEAAAPDGRAYELVSPVNHNSGDVMAAMAATDDGNAIAYTANGLDDARGLQWIGEVVARRGTTAWETTDASATSLGGAGAAAATLPVGISADLSQMVVDSPFAFDANDTDGPNSYDLYKLTVGTGAIRRMTVGSDSTFASATTFIGNSTDFGHLFFDGGQLPLLPGVANGSLYEQTPDGVLHLASVMPNGTPAPSPAGVSAASKISGMDTVNAATDVPAPYGGSHVVSDDGSRFFFQNAQLLLMRQGGTTTVPISASQRTGSVGNPSTNSTFVAASHDGNVVYFVSNDRLTDAATVGGGLYRYTVSTGQLVQLTVDAGAASAGIRDAVASDDASHVYFFSTRVLATGGTLGQQNLYVWSGGTTRFVGDFQTDSNASVQQVSRDGRYLAVTSTTSVGGASNNGFNAVYRWDDQTAQLVCASCYPDASPSQGDVYMRTQAIAVPMPSLLSWPRVLTDTGQVFFNTNDPLSPDDRNTAYDAYEYENGNVSLLSSGRGADDSWFQDSTPNGHDAFFVTRESLVAGDTDSGLASLYDARVDGGLPNPPTGPAPCRAEGCQAAPGDAPDLPDPTSSHATGPGNLVWVPAAQKLTVHKLSTADRSHWARTGMFRVRVTVTGGGLVQLRAKAKIGKRTSTVGTASTMVATSSTTTVRVSLGISATARRELQRKHRLKLTLLSQLAKKPVQRTSVTLTRTRG
jgi:hypothetical protein